MGGSLVITVIDYGMGNLRSVSKALEMVGAKVRITSEKEAIRNADGIVLPGVGAFSQAMENLKRFNLIPAIREFIERGRPFLGICLGFQLLFSESEEGGAPRGLDIIKGKVRRFRNRMKVPHMGWNELKPEGRMSLLSNIHFPCFVYFAHSYYVEPEDREVVATITEYGIEFVSMVQKNNIYGVQFHPEKSGEKGLKILRNFCNLV
jgi:glutamine amidotransferase